MAVKKKNNATLFIIGGIILGVMIILAIFLIYRSFGNKSDKCPDNHVCIQKRDYETLPKPNQTREPKIVIIKESSPYQTTDTRDRRVLNDQLYPPLNRTDSMTFDGVVRETRNRNINVPSNQTYDSYRMVGYVKSKSVGQEQEIDAGGNSWKMMAREKNRNESDFYLIPTNNNYDLKIPITPDIVVGQRLRDVYTIPNEIQFKSPMLNQTPYQFIELPKTDFTDPRYS